MIKGTYLIELLRIKKAMCVRLLALGEYAADVTPCPTLGLKQFLCEPFVILGLKGPWRDHLLLAPCFPDEEIKTGEGTSLSQDYRISCGEKPFAWQVSGDHNRGMGHRGCLLLLTCPVTLDEALNFCEPVKWGW